MKLTFIGADHEVTGSCHLVEACGKNILVDCGMEQGPDLYENQEIPVASGRYRLYSPDALHISITPERFRYSANRDFMEKS